MKYGIIAVIILAIVLIGGFFLYQSMNKEFTTGSTVTAQESSGNSENTNNQDNNVKVINIDASRFQYTPGTITVKKGDHVKIIINSIDTPHGIAIPELGVSGVESVEFTADKAGTFEFHCPTPCGSGHRTMKGTLVIEE